MLYNSYIVEREITNNYINVTWCLLGIRQIYILSKPGHFIGKY